jgi:hypothetical protein
MTIERKRKGKNYISTGWGTPTGTKCRPNASPGETALGGKEVVLVRENRLCEKLKHLSNMERER